MTDKKKTAATARPNLGRHEFGCKICAHPQRDEIERDFVSWMSPVKITSEYKLRNRASIYRHAHGLDLFSKRARNLRGALEHIIEKVCDVPVNAGAVVQAITAYARINARGELIERDETISVNDLFDRMSVEELQRYAKDGSLPDWFTRE
ncbi:MAG: hypothetical protein ACRD4C_04495 [Candidatus Acidiferrales bacterium]